MKTTLDHLPERKQQELHTIATILRTALDEFLTHKNGSKTEFRILKIILFGSHAKGSWVNDRPNGYISDYDILVIVNKPALVEEYCIWHNAEEQIERRVTSAPLGLIVHTLSEVNVQLQQGQYFFRDIREQGIELFSSTPKELILPGDLTKEERRMIAQKHFDHWFNRAADSIKKFNFTLQESMINEAAFDLHQAVERFLACTLLSCTNYLPKSHNIEKLGKLCAQIDPEFANIFPLDNKFHRRSFRRLQRAYIDARYSEHYEITVEELDYLQLQVEKLKALTERVCQAQVDTLGV